MTKHTPAECTMHFGSPVVPEENIIKSGKWKGNSANRSGSFIPSYSLTKSSRKTLWSEG